MKLIKRIIINQILNNSFYNILRNKSFREINFRFLRVFEKKIGFLKFKFPITPPNNKNLINLTQFKEFINYFIYKSAILPFFDKKNRSNLKEETEKIKNGEFKFFSKESKKLGLNYDWITNPQTNFKYNINKHWSEIESLNPKEGDIKFVWEKSRFSWLLTIIRNDYHNKEDNSEFVISQILDWIDKNPLNCGPNYVCSQEISIRLNNWIFALNYYKNSENLTSGRWNIIINSIYWQIEHVFNNINFSRYCVRNNHAITETLTLYLMGLLFSKLPNAIKWKNKGKKWFEKEIKFQIEDDGTYIQDSMNYHRVVVQLLTYAISLSDKNGDKFDELVYEKAYKSLNFLYQCQDPKTGWLPNYGSNDGALFFPLSSADYRDYRPQLDALHGLLTGKPLYGNDFLEDAQWIGHGVPISRKVFKPLKKQYGIIKFGKSGFYLFREKDTMTFIRCGKFKKKGITDEFHIDIWHNGRNILFDCGSYLYNTTPELKKYFSGTESQNTVMIDDFDQMQKGPRFMWFNAPEILDIKINEDSNYFYFEGTIKAFTYIDQRIEVIRKIKKHKESPTWEIIDTINHKPSDSLFRQIWHLPLNEMKNIRFHSNGNKKEKNNWYSSYYGYKEEAKQIEFQTKDSSLNTIFSIKH